MAWRMGRAFAVAKGTLVKWPNAVVWLAIDGHARQPKAAIAMTISRCEHLAEDPDVALVTMDPVQARAFSVARALVECLRRLEAVPIEPVRVALSRALREAKTTEAEILDCASRRRSRAIVTAALDVLRS